MLDKEATGALEGKSREEKKLHAIQLREALERQGVEAGAVSPGDALAVAKPKAKQVRFTGSRGHSHLQACWTCGSIDHKSPQCPMQPERLLLAQNQQFRVTIALQRNSAKAKLVSHLKYVNKRQRSEIYDSKPTKRSRAKIAICSKVLTRMAPFALTNWLIQNQLLTDLQGSPCPLENCVSNWGVISQSLQGSLGKLCQSLNPLLQLGDITVAKVFYRCSRCRAVFRVNFGSCLFSAVARHSIATWFHMF